MAIKVDLEKAYDRVRCDFLHSVLVERGFSNKWVSPLMSCVTASSLSVLWNGERTAAFTLGRGLSKAGVSAGFTYLFVLCMEKLARISVLLWTPKSGSGLSLLDGGPRSSFVCNG
ncbi:UNVERIFIED_CONTAM: hypothetical protein Scaly_3148400 [Sesamum calycinum]|uniref:Reverse transcriptase domain-containing protein n=1 Tax=Sesamum calycinum TaxID=2727403 RepID=A0AAW2JHI4_9LAMI